MDKDKETSKELKNYLNLFESKKKENNNVNWIVYMANHNDLLKNGVLNPAKAITHWLNHGLYEIRNYGNKNPELIECWGLINRFLRNNFYIHDNSAFIVTTSLRNNIQLKYLIECINNIRNIYEDKFIYIINDNSSEQYSNDFLEKIFCTIKNKLIISSIVQGGGELNPYLFILDPRCNHDKLIYIHDTVFLKSNIDDFIYRKNEIDFFWFAVDCVYFDTNNKKENIEICNNLYFYFGNGKINLHDYFNILKQYNVPFSVKFGSMSVFTKKFMEKVRLATNLTDVAFLFTNRINRSLVERLLTVFVIFIYGSDVSIHSCLCGNIFSHPLNFVNKNPNISYNSPLVKVWQGR